MSRQTSQKFVEDLTSLMGGEPYNYTFSHNFDGCVMVYKDNTYLGDLNDMMREGVDAIREEDQYYQDRATKHDDE